jgi:hypothetical protein
MALGDGFKGGEMTCMGIKVLTHVLVQNLGDINDHAPLDVEQPRASILNGHQRTATVLRS